MKFTNICNNAILGICALAIVQSQAGHDVGNGLDNVAWANVKPGMAWFQNEVRSDRKIQVCIEVRERKFGYSKKELSNLVLSSIEKWKNYARLSGKRIRVAFEAEIQNSCVFSNFDLKILFGETDRDVEKHLKDFTRPLGFSVLTDFVTSEALGKGFIYIAPDQSLFKDRRGQIVAVNWQDPFKLEGAILHELGHVFGVSHVDGTIMDPVDLEDNLLDDYSATPEYQKAVYERLTHIDGRMKLLFDHTASDFFDFDFTRMHRKALLDRTFQVLLGRLPEGVVRGTITLDAIKIIDGARNRSFPGSILLHDTLAPNGIELKLTISSDPVATDSLALAFSTLHSGYAMGGLTQIANTTSADGRNIRLTIKRSMNFQLLEICQIDSEFGIQSLIIGK